MTGLEAYSDFCYFYEHCVVLKDKDGNTVQMPPLTELKKEFVKFLEEAKAKGATRIYTPQGSFTL